MTDYTTPAQQELDHAVDALGSEQARLADLQSQHSEALASRAEVDARLDTGDLDGTGTGTELVSVNATIESLTRRIQAAEQSVAVLSETVHRARVAVTYAQAQDIAAELAQADFAAADAAFLAEVQAVYDRHLAARYELADREDQLRRLAGALKRERPSGTTLTVDARSIVLDGEAVVFPPRHRPADLHRVLDGLVDVREEARVEQLRAEAREDSRRRNQHQREAMAVQTEATRQMMDDVASAQQPGRRGYDAAPATNPRDLGSSYASLVGETMPYDHVGTSPGRIRTTR